MKRLLTILLLLSAAAAQAVTISANLMDSGYNTWGTRARFIPLSTPMAVGSNTVFGLPVSTAITNGAFTLQFVGGFANFDAGSGLPFVKVLYPLNDTNTYNLNDGARLAAQALMWAGSNITVTVQGGGAGVTNNQTLTGIPVGNGQAFTNLAGSNIQDGTVGTNQLSQQINTNLLYAGNTNSYGGGIFGYLAGNGSGLTNLPVMGVAAGANITAVTNAGLVTISGSAGSGFNPSVSNTYNGTFIGNGDGITNHLGSFFAPTNWAYMTQPTFSNPSFTTGFGVSGNVWTVPGAGFFGSGAGLTNLIGLGIAPLNGWGTNTVLLNPFVSGILSITGSVPAIAIFKDGLPEVDIEPSDSFLTINDVVNAYSFDGNGSNLVGVASTNLTGRAIHSTNANSGLVIDATRPYQLFITNATYTIAGFSGLVAGFQHVFSQTISNSSGSTLYSTNAPGAHLIGGVSTNALAIPSGKEAVRTFWIWTGIRTNETDALEQ